MAKRGIALLLAFICFWTSLGSSRAAILDDKNAKGADAALLRSLAPSLHRNGIDTILGNALKIDVSSNRPRLAPLKGYHANARNWDEILSSAWAQAFQEGMFGALIALRPSMLHNKKADCDTNAKADADACAFVNDWLNTEPDKRIFVAFTSADVGHAEKVKKSLEKDGFVVFVFMKAGENAPWADAGLVGEVFAQASHRFVVDTQNSRNAVGVALEGRLCEFLLTPAPPLSRWAEMIGGKT